MIRAALIAVFATLLTLYVLCTHNVYCQTLDTGNFKCEANHFDLDPDGN